MRWKSSLLSLVVVVVVVEEEMAEEARLGAPIRGSGVVCSAWKRKLTVCFEAAIYIFDFGD